MEPGNYQHCMNGGLRIHLYCVKKRGEMSLSYLLKMTRGWLKNITSQLLGAEAHAYNPNTLGGRGGWIMRSRDRDHPGQQGETPSLLKIQKLDGHGGARL